MALRFVPLDFPLMYSALRHFQDFYGVATPKDRLSNSASQNVLSVHQHDTGILMDHSRGKNNGSLPGTDEANTSRVSTAELVDFVKEQALRHSIKGFAKLSGLSTKAVENIRDGTAAASGTTLTTLCRNSAEFRAEYFFFVGGHMECDPEFVKGITMALQSLARRNNP